MAEKQPTIQNFISSMNASGGFARTSKYAVVITPPARLELIARRENVIDIMKNQPGLSGEQQAVIKDYDSRTDGALNFLKLSKQVGRQVNLHCTSVSMPGHDLQAQDMQHGSAPGRQIVTSHDYNGTISATFYLDSHLRERHFFEMWQQMAVNINSHKANYYDDYIGSMEIFQLDLNGDITYGIKATEVYPTTLAGIEYAYANANQIALQAVSFQYRQWFNMTADTIAGYNEISRFKSRDTKKGYNEIRKTYGPTNFTNQAQFDEQP